jgi:hypothetical protein
MDPQTQTELEAAAFRALVHHLMVKRPDVQNIDLMNLGGFCRNCLSRWYQEAAADRGIEMTKDAAREVVYGMPYADWVAQNQTEADQAKKAAFEVSFRENVGPKGALGALQRPVGWGAVAHPTKMPHPAPKPLTRQGFL